jgi:dinuclear metal center YbgI/SA1388 family protein
MADLEKIVQFCDNRVQRKNIRDFKGSVNGLQVSNNGNVKKVGAAVDAGLIPFREASARNIDLLIVHHGLFWTPPIPLTGVNYEKVKFLMDENIAVYSSHLPLDAHPEIGNNVLLAKALNLEVERSCFPYEGTDLGVIATGCESRDQLHDKLSEVLGVMDAIEFGSSKPQKVAILTGSGASAVEELLSEGVDTLITGELRQHHYNMAQELKLNLYPCGHYTTETFGVKALAKEISEKFGIPWEFIPTNCPL